MQKDSNKSGINLRAIVIGLLLIVPNNYFAIRTRLPATSSLIYLSVFNIFFLALLNMMLKRFVPRLAMKQGDLVAIYAMLCAAIVLVGHDFIQMMAPSFTYGFWYATPENEWSDLFWNDIPRWLANSDRRVMIGIYEGESSLYDWRMIKAWAGPVIWWSAFLFAVIYAMLCLNVFIRRQWIEREKLVYPIIRLPLEICRDGGSSRFFKNKLLWMGFGVAGFIDLINGLNVLYGVIPGIPVHSMDIGRYFLEKPLSAISRTPIMFFPYVTGIGFFMPLDLSFSYWFLYLFWKLQAIAGVALGAPVESNLSVSRVIHTQSQVSGAYLVIGLIGLWMARQHLKSVFKRIFGLGAQVDDSEEPMRYRGAVVGLALSLGFVFLFCLRSGMTFWVIALFISLYCAIGISLTYIRAQLGPPVHQMFGQGPDSLIPQVLGTRVLSKNDMVMFTFFWGFNRSQRGNSMPHQLEAFKMSEQLRMDNRRLARAIIIATAFGLLVAFWSYFDLRYRYGTNEFTYEWGSRWAFNRLQAWLTNPIKANNVETLWMGLGSSFVVLLSILRTRFVWWPIHPVAYPLSSPGWGSDYTWSSIFISWLAKFLVLKYGGHRAHSKAAYFFAGLILGDCIVGGAWDIIGVAFGVRTYVFGLG
ncbi:DUF6785 family protein [Candidatus Poribacteria bacterium]